MIRRDYLLRLIEQVIRLLQAVFGLVDLRRYPEALAMLSEGYRQFFGMDSDTLIRLPLPFLREQLGDDSEGTHLMATLLEAEGDILTLMGQEAAALARWDRALTLLLDARDEGWFVATPEIATSVDTLAERLRPFSLPATLTARLFRHYAAAGDYALAEDYLWEWLESDAADEQSVAEGAQFYQQLLAMDDASLNEIGFTRDELITANEELRRRLP